MPVYKNLKAVRKLTNSSLTSIIDITNLNFASLSNANLEFLTNIKYDEVLNTFQVYRGTFDFVNITDKLSLTLDGIPTFTIDSLGRAEGQQLLVKVAETKRQRFTDFNDWPEIGVPGEIIYTGIQNQRPQFGEDFIGYLQSRGWVSLTEPNAAAFLTLYELAGSPPVPACPAANTGIIWVGPPGYETATVPTTQTLYYTDENCNIYDLTGGGGGGATLISITYAQLVTAIGAGTLIPGQQYLLTNYQTVYDQPDYDNSGAIKYPIVTKTGTVEPLILTATSTTTISATALSTVWPGDRIQYDWSFSFTELGLQPALGRISERITADDNNRTSYDHRAVLFKRYADTLTGCFTEINEPYPGATYRDDTPTFGVECDNMFLGGIFDGFGFDDPAFIVPNSIFGDYCESVTTGGDFYNNTIGSFDPVGLGAFCYGTVFGHWCHNNKIGDGFYNNRIFNEFSNNVIGSDFNQNDIGNGFSENLIGNRFIQNTILSNFKKNIISDSVFLSNVIDDDFLGNEITKTTFQNNSIEDYFQNNTIGDSYFSSGFFQNNQIGDSCSNNYMSNFTANQIGFSFFGNGSKFAYIDTFDGNRIGDHFEKNFAYNFYNNRIGDYFNNNGSPESKTGRVATFSSAITFPTAGGYTTGTYLDIPTLGAGIGFTVDIVVDGAGTIANFSDIVLNSQGTGYQTGNIVVIDGAELGGVSGVDDIELMIESISFVANYCYEFHDNIIGNYFQTGNQVNNLSSNKIGDYFQTNGDQNTPCSDMKNNVIGDGFKLNFVHTFNSNHIGNDFVGNTGWSKNSVFSNFISNQIGDNFQSNKMPDIFGSNKIGNAFFRNTFQGKESGDNLQYFGINPETEQNDGNVIGDYFAYNAFSSVTGKLHFTGNHIGNYFGGRLDGKSGPGNTISGGQPFADNYIGNDFFSNYIYLDGSGKAGFIGNTIGTKFWYNAIHGDFSYNTLGSFFQTNVSNGFQYNWTQYAVIGVDFTANPATHVYNPYTCNIFANSTGTLRLSYFDNLDVQIITDPDL